MPKLLKRLALGLATFLFVALGLVVVSYFVLVRPYRLHGVHIDGTEISSLPGNYLVALTHGGRKREYILHVPPGGSSGAMPLLLALHGRGGRARDADDGSHLTPVADREHFLVAFPQGIGQRWNDEGLGQDGGDRGVDDVAFIEAVIDDIAAKLPVDKKRVFAAGVSNGGFMSTLLACDSADKIAAIAVVDATAHAGFEMTCRPSRPVPVISFNGTADPLVPFNGGNVGLLIFKGGRVVSADEYQSFWVGFDGCPLEPAVTPLPDTNKKDGSHVVEEAFGPCRANAALDFYTVIGGGHTWPGGKQYLSPLLVGKTNRDVDASELIWRFFATHPMP